MFYQITLEDSALADIKKAARWIARKAKSNRLGKMSAWVDALHAAIGTLDQLPFRCPFAPENVLVQEEIRQLLFQQHRIIYAVRGDTVNILHVRHQRQKPLTRGNF